MSDRIAIDYFRFVYRQSKNYVLLELLAQRSPEGVNLRIYEKSGTLICSRALHGFSLLEKLLSITAEHRLFLWDGFSCGKTPGRQHEFTLGISFSDGSHVEAWGAGCFPKGFNEAFAEIKEAFFAFMADQNSSSAISSSG